MFGSASRDAATHVPAGLTGSGPADYVLTEGVTTAFTWGAVFAAITIVLTLFMRRIASPEPQEQATPDASSAAAEGALI